MDCGFCLFVSARLMPAGRGGRFVAFSVDCGQKGLVGP